MKESIRMILGTQYKKVDRYYLVALLNLVTVSS